MKLNISKRSMAYWMIFTATINQAYGGSAVLKKFKPEGNIDSFFETPTRLSS